MRHTLIPGSQVYSSRPRDEPFGIAPARKAAPRHTDAFRREAFPARRTPPPIVEDARGTQAIRDSPAARSNPDPI